MPGMSGLELQGHLIAHGPNIPVIFITAFPDDRIRERAMEGGAICFSEQTVRRNEIAGMRGTDAETRWLR